MEIEKCAISDQPVQFNFKNILQTLFQVSVCLFGFYGVMLVESRGNLFEL